jgi:hypothetical protein
MTIRTLNGNMFISSCLAMGLVILVLVIGFAFYLIFADQKHGEAQSDGIALNLAKSLNADDRIGQMNTIVEHSRELVYLSRQSVMAAPDLNVPAYESLADQFLTEAKDSALLVEKERRNQIDIAVLTCRDKILTLCNEKANSGYSILPWFFEDQLSIKGLQLGSIDSNFSNISAPQAVKALRKFDLDHHYIDGVSGLYCGNINAKLPQPDDELPFCLSSLPARVENTDCPARLTRPDAFISTALIFDDHSPDFSKPAQLPEAVEVIGSMRIITANRGATLEIPSSSIATAPGALDSP